MKNLVFPALLAALLIVSCEAPSDAPTNDSVTPSTLLLEIADNRRFISTDEVADKIINDDPSLQLIDIRSADAFATFSLPGAIHIPLANILDQKDLDCNKYTYVFYSNDDIHAEQAWVLRRRTGCKGSYILKGGLNKWVETIMRPTPPPATAASDELDLYQFRKAASIYFAGGSRAMDPAPYSPPATKVAAKKDKPKPKKVVKQEDEEGGC